MKTLLDELHERLKAPGMSHRKLEVALGLPENELKGILDASQPRTPSVTKAMRIARSLGLDFYVGPKRSPVAQSVTPTLAKPDDFLQVPVLDVALAAGDGRHNYGEEVVSHLAFRKDWLRGIGVSPSAAVIARAEGESMYPTIRDGDLVLIDRGRAEPPAKVREPSDQRPAPIYAVLDGDGSRVKRLELAAPGVLALASDNPTHQTEYRPLSAVSIIGRVMWWGHTNKE